MSKVNMKSEKPVTVQSKKI